MGEVLQFKPREVYNPSEAIEGNCDFIIEGIMETLYSYCDYTEEELDSKYVQKRLNLIYIILHNMMSEMELIESIEPDLKELLDDLIDKLYDDEGDLEEENQ